MAPARRHGPVVLIALGIATGLLSGFFGVGGGIVLVPLLMSVLRFQPRLAAGTSVAAILPVALVGGSSYAVQGLVDWYAAIALMAGIIVGAQLGSLLLNRVPVLFLRWLFIVFLVGVIVSLWVVVPERGAAISVDPLTITLLLVLGLGTGVISGLVGVGGGVIVVPMLMMGFGASDLIAKGTSLVMLVPGSLSGTIGNIRRQNVDVRAAMYLGISASVVSPLGAIAARAITPEASNMAFSILLALIVLQMLLMMRRNNQ